MVPDFTMLGKKRSYLYEIFANGFIFCMGSVILKTQAVKVRPKSAENCWKSVFLKRFITPGNNGF